jgi:dCTP deaminase
MGAGLSVLGAKGIEDVILNRSIGERLVVMPLLDRSQIGEASLDVRLGTRFHILRRTQESGLDPRTAAQSSVERGQDEVVAAIGEPLWLHPGQFMLGATLEYFRFPRDLAADVVGRSSWGRLGLLVATAVMVQPGYRGTLTLELVNHGDGPIALYPGSRIAQLAIHPVLEPPETPYAGKYIGPTGPQVSHLAREREEIEALRRTAQRFAAA